MNLRELKEELAKIGDEFDYFPVAILSYDADDKIIIISDIARISVSHVPNQIELS